LYAPRDACLDYIGSYCSNVHERLRMPNWIRAREDDKQKTKKTGRPGGGQGSSLLLNVKSYDMTPVPASAS
jgi:hypothetical protein